MHLKANADRAMADWLLSRFKDQGSFGLIAETDSGNRTGFLLGRIDFWESVPPIIESRNIGIIDAIYVQDAFRRKGIATLLINHATEHMRKRGAVAIETIYDAWSDASAETWRRAGFAPWMVHASRML
jgi:GNAT superfamily N-acetyltransferase